MSEHLVFDCNAGSVTEREGAKGIFFPHYIRIVMDRRTAWDIFHALSHELMEDNQNVLQVYIYGKLSPEQEEGK